MFILKSKTTTSLLTFQHWSMVCTLARPNGKCLVTMGLFKDAETANDPQLADNNLETIDVSVDIDPSVFVSTETPIAQALYLGLVAAPAEGQEPGFFSGCEIGK